MLPQPSIEARNHSDRLQARIRQRISDQGGWIGFADFMNMALYTPELGYYTGGLHKIGQQGDFTTAPELGNLFARCLAAECMHVWQKLSTAVDDKVIYEFGAGTGKLARDMLLAMNQQSALPDHYAIIETSGQLCARQQALIQTLPDHIARSVSWSEHLPEQIRGIVIGNELLDAMPCDRFRICENGEVAALGVAVEADQLVWRAGESFANGLATGMLPPDYESEVCTQAEAWVKTIGKRLSCGVLLLIDYGFSQQEFYHHDRRAGTLMCHYRHHAHDNPFWWPGLQDITTHIDFTAIADAAQSVDLSFEGYIDQSNYLISCGLIDFCSETQNSLADIEEPDKSRRLFQLTSEVKKLTMPHEMGELFKVIAFSRNFSGPLKGFTRRNNVHRLIND